MKSAPKTLALAAAAVLSSSFPAHAATADRWAGAWGYAAAPAGPRKSDTLPAGTYRFRVRPSQSGNGVRLTFTNPAGAVPLDITRASIAKAAGDTGFALDPGFEHALRFADANGTTIAPGKATTTAPIDFPVSGGADLIVSVATGGPSTTVGADTGFPAAFAEHSVDAAGTGLQAQHLRPFLSLVAVRNPPAGCTIVALGDSITEGVHGTGTSWPGSLAEHLIAAEPARHCSVVNEGIGGNRLLRTGRGPAALARFDRDVASVPGVTDMILLEGINDVDMSGKPNAPKLTAQDLIAGYQAMIAKAHARGIRVIGATLTPNHGLKAANDDLEQIRQDTNRWIRTSGAFDAVIDFEAAVRDDGMPPKMKPMFDSGDHLHPNAAGYEAMGKAVPLSLFPAR